jgi:hypothetical protein
MQRSTHYSAKELRNSHHSFRDSRTRSFGSAPNLNAILEMDNSDFDDDDEDDDIEYANGSNGSNGTASNTPAMAPPWDGA